jgi:hypothetical protein
VADRVGKPRLDHPDFAETGGVEMADAGGPHLVQYQRCRIGFHRIHRRAGETVEKALGRGFELRGLQSVNRLDRLQDADGFFDSGKTRDRHGQGLITRVQEKWAPVFRPEAR